MFTARAKTAVNQSFFASFGSQKEVLALSQA
jgi:hypothetical protein